MAVWDVKLRHVGHTLILTFRLVDLSIHGQVYGVVRGLAAGTLK